MSKMDGITTGVDVQAINKLSREVLLGDGRLLKMTQLHEIDGTETDDMEEAAFATVEMEDGKWFPIIFSEYDEPKATH